MLSINFMLFFIPLLSLILIGVNFLLAPHTPYKEKKTPFECGYHSFTDQTRTQFNILFAIFMITFLILDLEIVLAYPSSTSLYNIEIYGLSLTGIFVFMVTSGFVFELGKGALNIESKQSDSNKTLFSKKGILHVLVIFKIIFSSVTKGALWMYDWLFKYIIDYIKGKFIVYVQNKVIKPLYNKFFTRFIPPYQKFELYKLVDCSQNLYRTQLNLRFFRISLLDKIFNIKNKNTMYFHVYIPGIKIYYILDVINGNNNLNVRYFFFYLFNLSLSSAIVIVFSIYFINEVDFDNLLPNIAINALIVTVVSIINDKLFFPGCHSHYNSLPFPCYYLIYVLWL